MLNIEKYKDEILKGWEETNDLERVLYKIISQYNYCCTKEVQIKWLLSEYDAPPITLAEQEFLANAIELFKDKVLWISKNIYTANSECIAIYYEYDGVKDAIQYPPFDKGTMYKNMELAKHYTLEELGINYDSRKEE